MNYLEGGAGLVSNWTSQSIIASGHMLFNISVNGSPLIKAIVSPTSSGGPGLVSKWHSVVKHWRASTNNGANTLQSDVTVQDPYPDFFDGIQDQVYTIARASIGWRTHHIRFRTSTYDSLAGTWAADGELNVVLNGVSVLSLSGLYLNFLPTTAQNWTVSIGLGGDAGWLWATNKNETVPVSGAENQPNSVELQSASNFQSGTLDGWTIGNSAYNGATLGAPPYYWFHGNSGSGSTRGISVYSTDTSQPMVPAGGPGSRSINTALARTFQSVPLLIEGGSGTPPTGTDGTPECCADGPAGPAGGGTDGGGGEGCDCTCDCPPAGGSNPGGGGVDTSAGHGGGGEQGTHPSPVGILPPWTRSCTGGGLVDTVADLSDGESWL